MPTPEFWNSAGVGLGLFLTLSGFGLAHYLSFSLKPCKHEWEYMNAVHWDGKKVADKFRCIHCCKRKEV